MPWYLWSLLVVCAICLPFECRRFYRGAKRGELSLWAALDILASLGIIAAAIAYWVMP